MKFDKMSFFSHSIHHCSTIRRRFYRRPPRPTSAGTIDRPLISVSPRQHPINFLPMIRGRPIPTVETQLRSSTTILGAKHEPMTTVSRSTWPIRGASATLRRRRKRFDNELSEFFGASATISTAQNPWNPPAQPASISPINLATTVQPTNGNSSNSNSTSPYPPAVHSALRKTPESFLGDKFSTLVDLNQLVTQPKGKSSRRFSLSLSMIRFQRQIRSVPLLHGRQIRFANTNKPPTLEQLSSLTNVGFSSTSTLPPPLIPSSFNSNSLTAPTFNATNPFM